MDVKEAKRTDDDNKNTLSIRSQKLRLNLTDKLFLKYYKEKTVCVVSAEIDTFPAGDIASECLVTGCIWWKICAANISQGFAH